MDVAHFSMVCLIMAASDKSVDEQCIQERGHNSNSALCSIVLLYYFSYSYGETTFVVLIYKYKIYMLSLEKSYMATTDQIKGLTKAHK